MVYGAEFVELCLFHVAPCAERLGQKHAVAGAGHRGEAVNRDTAVKEVRLKLPELFIIAGEAAGGKHHRTGMYGNGAAGIVGDNAADCTAVVGEQLHRLMLGVYLNAQRGSNLKHFADQVGAGPAGADGGIVAVEVFKLAVRIVDAQRTHGAAPNGEARSGFFFIKIHQPFKEPSGVPKHLFHQRIRQTALCLPNAVFQQLFGLIRNTCLLMPAIVAGEPVVGQRGGAGRISLPFPAQ